MKFANSSWLLLPAMMLSIHSHAQNVFKIENNTTVHLNGGVVVTLHDMSLDNDGTLNPAIGSGRIIFSGSTNNLVRGNGITNFDQLEIAKTANSILTLQTNTDISSGIWFNGGFINLENSIVNLPGNASLHGESESSRAMASGTGYLQVNTTLNAPQDVNPGNLGAIISSKQNLGPTLIRRGHQQLTVEGDRTSILRYYEIVPQNNTGLDAILRMHYADGEVDKQAENALDFHFSEAPGKWLKISPDSRNTTANYVQLQGLSSFGLITLAEGGTGLPVIFSAFSVTCGNNETRIHWATSFEQNASHFDVQRSADGTTWTTIATIPAAGNSTIEKRYAYTDRQPQGKYYRIKEVDLDGKEQYSIVGVADCEISTDFKAWPNPAQDQLFVNLKANRTGSAAIQIFNSAGKLVRLQHNGLAAGNNKLHVDMKGLPKGYYHIEVIWDEGVRKSASVLKN